MGALYTLHSNLSHKGNDNVPDGVGAGAFAKCDKLMGQDLVTENKSHNHESI